MSAARPVVLSGATGFIGRALAERLVREGVPVHCLARKGSRTDALERLGGARVLRIERYCSAALDAALAGLQPGVVYNLASYGVKPEDRDAGEMLEGNVGVASALLHAAARRSAALFVQIGSCSEYAQAHEGRLLAEDHAIAPASLYGGAKAAAVIYGDALARELGVEFVTVRLFGVYGPGEAPYRLVPYLMDRLQRGEPVDLTPGEQVRDLLYIDDVIDALVLASRLPGAGAHRVYNVCSGVPLRVRAVAEAVCEAMAKPAALLRFGQRPYRTDEWMWIVGDSGRFCSRTGWRPRVGLREGLERMLAARRDRNITATDKHR